MELTAAAAEAVVDLVRQKQNNWLRSALIAYVSHTVEDNSGEDASTWMGEEKASCTCVRNDVRSTRAPLFYLSNDMDERKKSLKRDKTKL